ncbi:hypothetical protein [Curtobacterium sp. MMLR14_010]|uniref:hypothetical protein n=1 Tax=Curtobacterium sp. MMLR14_010 TaxID=1898743 RepID=UPI001113B5B9|nr:hypothetical protein [Curtobacterium sp. MMLR14_010]
MASTVQSEPPGAGRYTAARVLLVCSAAGFAILWVTLWVPVLLTGSEGSLFLYPIVFLLAAGPWAGAWTALALAGSSLKAGGSSRNELVLAFSAILLALGPVLLWFGPTLT